MSVIISTPTPLKLSRPKAEVTFLQGIFRLKQRCTARVFYHFCDGPFILKARDSKP